MGAAEQKSLRSPVLEHPLFPKQTILTSRRPFLIIFTTKSYLRSETCIAREVYAMYLPKEDF